MKITVDQIEALRPCERYPRERIEELWAGREAISMEEMCKLEIPHMDIV